jgi:twitching motility protein PilJ
MAKSSARSQFLIILLGGGGAVAIVVGAFAIFLAGTLASSNAEFRVHLAELGMLSQTIAKTTDGAASGDREAFNTLATSRDRFDQLLRESRGDASGDTAQELERVAGNWDKVAPAVKTVLDARDPMQVAREQAAVVAESMPQVLKNLSDISDVTSRVGGNQRLLHALGQQISYGQLIQRDVVALTTGGGDVAGASQRLTANVAYFGRMMRSLYDGDPEFGIGQQPLADPNARGFRDAANELYPKLNGALTTLTSMQNTLVNVRNAVLTVSTSSNDLLNSARGAQSAFTRDSEGAESGTRILGFVLLVAGLLVIGVIFFMFNLSSDSRRAAELQQQQQERNQEAILRLLDELGSLADGDLTVQATVTEDITGAIADSINFAIEALRDLVVTINDTALQVDANVRQTQQTAAQLLEASTVQTKQIGTANQQIQQMTTSIEQVSANAERSAKVAQQSVEIANKGGVAVRRTIDGMNSIRENIQETAKRIKRLGESSQEIGNIVELINDIAEQTNILALNAAIQASMAGEAGRGFAVVADEVQRLAERSANATKQIEALVKTIQSDTNEAVASMEQSTAGVVSGAQLAENAGSALDEIEKVSNHIATLIQSISAAARQQAVQAGEVSRTMNSIQDITSQTAAGTNATAQNIGKLATLATELRKATSGFKLPGQVTAQTMVMRAETA